MLSAKNVVKPGYSVFIRHTTSAGVVWLLTTLSHSLYIVGDRYLQKRYRRLLLQTPGPVPLWDLQVL